MFDKKTNTAQEQTKLQLNLLRLKIYGNQQLHYLTQLNTLLLIVEISKFFLGFSKAPLKRAMCCNTGTMKI